MTDLPHAPKQKGWTQFRVGEGVAGKYVYARNGQVFIGQRNGSGFSMTPLTVTEANALIANLREALTRVTHG